ncbi:unnamed protein product [Bursaphelenchus okinawaensis]|uniref:NADH:flavin oxidoreductase/NADH oxidase N-terminal domain-containing protein n=1 Tax=Bursaphelenchus okinawaensis TaxID=465554 RepID=A0A811JRF3_9BILA|nr:unnamed protein product [Bursaphelenchus okinawaensis]CAG9079758.1 unnamed protein product [Bursaphelenchus okinawaensis]
MVVKRFEVPEPVDVAILGEELKFRTSGRVARNRFMKAAMSEYVSTFDKEDASKSGHITPVLQNMYEKWGQGGFGVILTGNLQVDPKHLEAAGNHILSKENWSEEKAESLRKLAAGAKADGALFLAQLGNAGRQTPAHLNPHPFCPSEVPLKSNTFGNTYGTPVALTLEQIQTEIIDRIVFTCQKLHEAGFDGIELHGAHGYMLAQFISPTTNLRTDRYGGSAEKRAQILVDVYNAIREQLPASTGFVVGIKMNSVEFQSHGMGIEDAITTAKIVDATGFDFIEFSGGTYEKFGFERKDSTKKRESFFTEFTEAIMPHLKNTVVYVTGGFRTTPAMVQAIKDGATNGIGLGRPTSAEPDIPNKILGKQALATSYNPVDNDFVQTFAITTTQMGQAGALPYAECHGDPAYGIFDQSDEKEYKVFSEEYETYFKEKLARIEKGEIPTGVFEYNSKYL